MAALPFLVHRLYALFPGIVGLILIFRCHLLRYAVVFVVIGLLVLPLLFLFVHAITSGIVCAGCRDLYQISGK